MKCLQHYSTPASFVLSFACSAVAFPALSALEPNSYVTDNGLTITPYLELKQSYDNNFTKTDGGESTWITAVSPLITAKGERGPHRVNAEAGLSSKLYSLDSSFNNTDYFIKGNASIQLESKHKLFVEAGYNYTHDEPGDGVSEGAGDQLDEVLVYDEFALKSLYQYGSEGSKGLLSFSADYSIKEYQNYRYLYGNLASRATRFKDNDVLALGAKLDVKTRDDWFWFIDISTKDSKFPFDASQDSRHNTYYVGTTWDFSGKTSGTAKLGWQDKSYESDYKDFTSASWAVGLTWKPVEHATIGLDTSKLAEDPSVGNGTNDTTKWTGFWKHQWKQDFSTKVSLGTTDEDYTSGGRKDQTDTWGVSADYQINRWSEVSFGVDFNDKTSNRSGFAYEQTVSYISFKLTI